MKPDSVLVFFTDTFPCGKGETFIENEFPFLARAFARIYIVTNNMSDPVTRLVSPNTKVIRYPYAATSLNKVHALTRWFSLPLKEERRFMQKGLGLASNRQRQTIMLGTFAKMLETETFLNKLFDQEQIDKGKAHLYAYWFNDMAASLAWFKSKNPEVKAFCRAHRWDIYAEGQPTGYLPFRQFTIANINACYPISVDGARYIKNQTGHIADNKIHVARLGTTAPSGSLPNGNTDKISLVSCSYVIERKRIDLLISALEKISDIDIEWTHFGAGPLLEQMQRLATQKLGNKKNITYRFAGHISNTDLMKEYQINHFDLFVNLSSSEGVPVSIMEAISYGIPAIATDTGGSREVVVENQSGYLLPVEVSTEQVAYTINQFWQLSSADKQKLRANAYCFWDTHFNAQKNYTAFLESLQRDL